MLLVTSFTTNDVISNAAVADTYKRIAGWKRLLDDDRSESDVEVEVDGVHALSSASLVDEVNVWGPLSQSICVM